MEAVRHYRQGWLYALEMLMYIGRDEGWRGQEPRSPPELRLVPRQAVGSPLLPCILIG